MINVCGFELCLFLYMCFYDILWINMVNEKFFVYLNV